MPDKENLTTKWSEWTPCSKTCGDAKRKRLEYRCTSSSQEIRDCEVSGLQHEACVFKPCPGKCIGINGCSIQESDLSFTRLHISVNWYAWGVFSIITIVSLSSANHHLYREMKYQIAWSWKKLVGCGVISSSSSYSIDFNVVQIMTSLTDKPFFSITDGKWVYMIHWHENSEKKPVHSI